MPNIKSATKRMELSRAANAQNRAKRSRIRTAVKGVLQAESHEDADARYRTACALIDRAATKRLMHPNRAARMKSRLARHVQALAQ